jgi:hypothetical protein
MNEIEGEKKLARAMLVEALFDSDWPWLLSSLSVFWWELAGIRQPQVIPIISGELSRIGGIPKIGPHK